MTKQEILDKLEELRGRYKAETNNAVRLQIIIEANDLKVQLGVLKPPIVIEAVPEKPKPTVPEMQQRLKEMAKTAPKHIPNLVARAWPPRSDKKLQEDVENALT